MIRIFLILAMLFVGLGVNGQEWKLITRNGTKIRIIVDDEPYYYNPIDENGIYDVAEQMPSFVGGNSALMDYIKNNLRYPLVAEENGVQGRVVVSFVVEKDGSLSGVKVVRSVDPSLDKEAVRLVEAMPKWNAGKQNGSCVRVRYNVPISFRLAEELKTETKPKVYKNYDVTALNKEIEELRREKEIEELRRELVKKKALK